MPQWNEEKRYKRIRTIKHDEVKAYMEWEFHIMRYDAFDGQKHKRHEDPYNKTFVLVCGMCDGENIDLFDLQNWFDKNREWINSLRKEAKMDDEQIYHLSYEQLKCGLIESEEIDIRNTILEAMVSKYYDIHHKEIWPYVEMRLFSVDKDVRFTAVACLSYCKYNQHEASFIATHLVSNDSSEDVRNAAQAYLDCLKR